MALIPCDVGWSDDGSWRALYKLLASKRDDRGNIARGEAIFLNFDGSLVSNGTGQTIACLSLKNCLVVDTGDALLMAYLVRAYEIRRVVEEIPS